MDINKIFNIFSTTIEPEDEDNSLLVDFSSHPLYWIGGFNKILNNQDFFKSYTEHIFNTLASELDLDEVERAGKFLMFEKAWGYIKNLNTENHFHLECIKEKSNNKFLENLITTIEFFEKEEEYEKCSILHNISEKVKEFLS